eukprot:m.19584 g.19584  ORF g.19584 m.19584 type:complete len:78 (+) comp12270_c0_seq1:51-284(+)
MSFLLRNKFLKFGAPMVILVVAGSYGLREFSALRVAARDEKNRKMNADEVASLRNTRRFSLEEEAKVSWLWSSLLEE